MKTIAEGSLAPDFELPDQDGARRAGRAVLLPGGHDPRTDSVDRQRQFVGAHGLDFPLLSDADGAVATQYGVRRRFLTSVRRATVVVDTDRTVLTVVTSQLNMQVHADRALEALRSRWARVP